MKQNLLFQACEANEFGKKIEYSGGAVYEAGFIFLLGQPTHEIADSLDKFWHSRMFICLSKEWEQELLSAYPNMIFTERFLMKGNSNEFDNAILHKFMESIPESYHLGNFDNQAYEQKPFGHGYNYATFDQFHTAGAGAVIRYGSEIVSSASSFLTFHTQVELNVSTKKEHRRKGLGLAVSAAMILECQRKKMKVHWDAQNLVSKSMAERLGFSLSSSYHAYSFVPPNAP